MTKLNRKRLFGLLAVLLILVLAFVSGCGAAKTGNTDTKDGKTAAPAGPDKDFFKGKTIKFIVATNPGGGYDAYARLIAPYLQKYLPGSTVIVENVPGAGHIIGATQVYDAKPDGLTIGTFNSGLIQQQIVGNKQLKFDLNKFTWLAKSTTATPVVVVGKKSPYQTFEALKAAKTPVKFGSAGAGSESSIDALVFAKVFNFPLKLIAGYGGQQAEMGMIKGEIDGLEASWDSIKPFVDRGDGVAILQAGEKKHPDLPNVPLAFDLLKDNPAGKSLVSAVDATAFIGKPIAAPPGVPKERAQALIEALKQAYSDAELKDKAAKMQLSLDPMFGDELAAKVKEALSQPADNVKALTEILTSDK